MFELNFSAIEKACYSVMNVYFAPCVVRTMLDTIPRREATSRSVKLFRELFQVVGVIVTKSARFTSGMLR